MQRKKLFSTFFLLLMILAGIQNVNAHPWGGLVIDEEGNIYFTFICPMVDDEHYACVWKIDTEEELREVLRSGRSPSDIILTRTPDRIIYGAERTGQAPNHLNSLWMISGAENSPLIEPASNSDEFFIQAYAVTGDGSVYFARDSRIFIRKPDRQIEELPFETESGRIQLLTVSPNGELYILAGDNLYKQDANSISLIAENLREDNPKNIPFPGANILFDMAVDRDGNVFIAYYGNRQIIQVYPDGERKVILEAKAPWSPHGVDVFNGEVFVLESTLGDGKWWKFWDRSDNEIIPRVRKVAANGTVSTVYEYEHH